MNIMGGLPDGSWIRVTFNETNVLGLKSRQPALFIDPGRQLFEEPTLFLHKHYVQSGARSSPETWEAAAYALQSWFDFLQATCKLSWRYANREKLIEYRDAYQIAISPKTGVPYASGTIGNRMLVVLAFYRYAAECGFYDGDLILAARDEVGKLLNVTNDAMAHTRRGVQTIRSIRGIIPKRRISRLGVRPFSRLELRAFLNATGPRATDRAGDNRATRTRLMADLGWSVGLRLDEIAQLKKFAFLSKTPDAQALAGEQTIEILGKGKVVRPVAIPNWLVLDILQYIETERKQAVNAGGLSGRNEPAQLLVSGLDSNFPGQPISKRRIQQEVEAACLRSGLIETVERIDPETGQTHNVKKAKHCVHDLRHTYAVLTYHAEVHNGNPEPWKKIQAQLGHRFLSTTINTYLGYVSVLGNGSSSIDLRKLLSI